MKKSFAYLLIGITLVGSIFLFPLKTNATDKCIELDLEDAQTLMRVAYAEAGNQGPDGMRLVMSVILNRVEAEDWPDTVKEVCSQRYQFSDAADIEDVSSDCHVALALIEMGGKAPEIVAFENKKSNKLDSYFDYAFTYKDQKFYTKNSK